MRNPFKRKAQPIIKYYTRTGCDIRTDKGFAQLPFCGEHQIFVRPGEYATVMMGVSVNLPEGVGAMVRINPGLTTVKSLYQDFVEVLPPGFQGDIRIRVQNRGKMLVYISPSACIATLIPISVPSIPIVYRDLKEVDRVGYNNLPD
jgi:dUTPase